MIFKIIRGSLSFLHISRKNDQLYRKNNQSSSCGLKMLRSFLAEPPKNQKMRIRF